MHSTMNNVQTDLCSGANRGDLGLFGSPRRTGDFRPSCGDRRRGGGDRRIGDLLIGDLRPGDHLLGGDLYGDPIRLLGGDRLRGEKDLRRSKDRDLDLNPLRGKGKKTGLGGEVNLCSLGGESGLYNGGAISGLNGGGGACGL